MMLKRVDNIVYAHSIGGASDLSYASIGLVGIVSYFRKILFQLLFSYGHINFNFTSVSVLS